jgi:hypothetical protein
MSPSPEENPSFYQVVNGPVGSDTADPEPVTDTLLSYERLLRGVVATLNVIKQRFFNPLIARDNRLLHQASFLDGTQMV